MEGLDFNALYIRKLREEYLDTKIDALNEIKIDIKEMLENAFIEGFNNGEVFGKKNEELNVKGRIIGNLLQNTDMSDEEIFDIVALDEEKWREHIKYLRGKYEEGLRIGREKFEKGKE